MDSELEKLKNECELIQSAIATPFYWTAIVVALLMFLPKFFAEFPACDVTPWHVFAAVGISCIARFAVSIWYSRRTHHILHRHYPEMFEIAESE